MFGHPSQHGHMHAGIQAAIKSPKTPKHLIPHLEQRMKKVNGKPITGATPKNAGSGLKGNDQTAQAEANIKKAPAPFAGKTAATVPTGKNSSVGAKPTKRNAKFFGR